LTRRGVTASAALAAIGSLGDPAKAAVSTALREATVRAAIRIASGSTLAAVATGRVAAWVDGASRSLAFHRKLTALGVLLAGTVGVGLAMLGAFHSPPQPRQEPPTPDDAREEMRREMLQLKGTWSTMVTVQSTDGGVPQPPKEEKMIWSIDRDTITQSDDGGFAGWTYRYTLDPDRSPRTIELRSLNAGFTLHGIYRLEGETLTVAYGHERPKRFEPGPTDMQLVLRRESRTPTKLSPEYPNADGCYWAIKPKPGGPKGVAFPSSMSTSPGINLILSKAPDGAMHIVLAYVTKAVADGSEVEYRPVALDRDKRRYLFEPGDGGTVATPVREAMLTQQEFRLDPVVLPFDRVRAMGIEVVPAEVRRDEEIKASERAIQEARDAGIDILPRPAVGQPFSYSLTDTKGRVLRSADLKGKVVLIDCWASWSGPCTQKLPRLKELYERRRGDGFEVIGLNFDTDRGRAERVVQALALPWPQVFVPADDRARRLWKDGPGLPSYPRSLLIDRQGILRHDGRPEELEAWIDSLLK
jgi:uncharacterized protein (TIGR03067 family)